MRAWVSQVIVAQWLLLPVLFHCSYSNN